MLWLQLVKGLLVSVRRRMCTWLAHPSTPTGCLSSIIAPIKYLLHKRFIAQSSCQVPCHYLNQCWLIVNRTPGNKFHRNCEWNSNVFTKEYVFDNVWPRSHCVNTNMACGAPYSPLDLNIMIMYSSKTFHHVNAIIKWLVMRSGAIFTNKV